MISYILILLAAILNSMMDVCQFHYSKSIFTKFNKPQYYDGSISWENKYVDGDVNKGMRKWLFGMNIPAAFTDFWHLCKSCMVILICFIASSAFYETPFLGKYIMEYITNFNFPILEKIIDFVFLGILWNCTFSLFYNKILIKK